MTIKWAQDHTLDAWLQMISVVEKMAVDTITSAQYSINDIDIAQLREKLHFGLKWGGEVILEGGEIENFKRCSWAVYYYITQLKPEDKTGRGHFIKMHNRVFKKE